MSQADEKADKNPLIVMMDESTGEKNARAVGKKWTGEENETEWLVKDMSEEMMSWGHQGGDGGHIILKSDGERSIVALRTSLAKFHGGKVVPEDPLRGESQSNWTVEEAGKTVREFVRLLREHVQEKAEVEQGVRWAAMMVSRFLVGKDGKERANKLESEWREGLWLEHSRRSNEAIIGTREGVVRAYVVKRMDDEGDPAAARPVTHRVGRPDQSEHRRAARGVSSTSRRASR